MKKALKIIGITLASLIGLVLIIIGITIAALNSSGTTTKAVNKYAPQFVNCDLHFGEARLNLFEAFPNMGIDITDVTLINPMDGSPSDSLASIEKLAVVVDAKKAWKEKTILVRECIVKDAYINLFTDSIGQRNFDVFSTSGDKDTVSSFDYLVVIDKLTLANSQVEYTDLRNGTSIQTEGVNLTLKGDLQGQDLDAALQLSTQKLALQMPTVALDAHDLDLQFDGDIKQMDQLKGQLKLDSPDLSLNAGQQYLKNDTLGLSLPLDCSLEQQTLHLSDAQISLNNALVKLSGTAAISEDNDYDLDIDLDADYLTIEDVLSRLPENIQQSIEPISMSGKLNIRQAKVKGKIKEEQTPLITAKVSAQDAVVNIPDLPYPFTDVDLDAFVTVDLDSVSTMTVNSLTTTFHRSNLNLHGELNDLLGDLGFNLTANVKAPMDDVKAFLPKNTEVAGYNHLDLRADFTLKDLKKTLKDYNLNRLKTQANLKIQQFAFDMDTIHATSPLLTLKIVSPGSPKGGDLSISLASNQLEAQVGSQIKGSLKDPDIKAKVDRLQGDFEKMKLKADVSLSQLNLEYDTISAQLATPSIELSTMPTSSSKGTNARIKLESAVTNIGLGKSNSFSTNTLKINSTVKQDKSRTDFLHRWNPTVELVLKNAKGDTELFKKDVHLNSLDVTMDTVQIVLKKSTFSIGQSDISLEGKITGFKEWINDHHNLMRGNLELTSELLNINEIMELTNGLGRSDNENKKEDEAETDASKKGPFMVPEGVDFDFVVRTNRSLFDNFDLNNLSGMLTVKDGTLILQEIGFTNKAAKMQLTAMYQSPRQNHLFLAMDFHLIDVQIRDLLDMIPYIDTLVPMLKTFDGQAEFHIGAETNLKSNYEPKISTLRAAADIEGKNLSVKDKFTFTKITNFLNISSNDEYRVDSLDVQLTAFKNEIDLWPSQIAMGKYKVTVDGRMTLDRNGEYHLSVTQTPLPIRMGLKISGPFNKLDYKLEECKYPNLYKPNKRSDREQIYYDMKKKIADELKSNVRM